MKLSRKVYSIVGRGAIFAGITAAIVIPSVVLTRHRSGSQKKSVINILKHYTKNHPVKIRYVAGQDANGADATNVIATFLYREHRHVFPDTVVFSGQLMPGEVRKIKVTFQYQLTIPIFVYEQKWNVSDVIRQFYNRHRPLKIKYIGEEPDSSNPAVSSILRQAMIDQDKSQTITPVIAKKIKFIKQFRPTSDPETFYVIFAKYQNISIRILIQESAKLKLAN